MLVSSSDFQPFGERAMVEPQARANDQDVAVGGCSRLGQSGL